MNKAYKYRIYPSKEQEVLFAKTFGCCRKVWNLMLGDREDFWESDRLPLSVTPAMYKDDYPYLKEVDSLALANVQMNLDTAYKAFFKGSGFPRFKSKKHARLSYTTNNQNGTVAVSDGHIRLPKAGFVRAEIHRTAPDGYMLRSATVSKEHDGSYYCSVLYEYKPAQNSIVPDADSSIGLDYKSDGLYMSSTGHCPDMPRFYRNSQKRLAKMQRRLSRKKGARKGEEASSNYKKQKQKVAKLQRHAANQRKDFLHKESSRIANSYDIVCVESLNMRSMASHSFGNGKATLDNGYGMFLNMLEYKLFDRGKYLVKVDKWYPSSQLCSRCGRKQKIKLSNRIYRCTCGMIMDRDHNAAINILNEGLRLLKKEAA